mmetsp:Transcript_26422/g.42393  ORF Transcript_26422/g.42393 Transcript_26422/m.42393 type:complete len:99 (+) Transcript_26422:1225-1521(+)
MSRAEETYILRLFAAALLRSNSFLCSCATGLCVLAFLCVILFLIVVYFRERGGIVLPPHTQILVYLHACKRVYMFLIGSVKYLGNHFKRLFHILIALC